jgi:hypothetical protein
MAKQGLKVITPSSKDIKELRAMVLKAVDPLADQQFSRSTFEEIKGFLKTLRKEN